MAVAASTAPPALLGLALPAALVVVWELLGRTGVVPQGILPAPSLVAATWWDWAFGARGMGLNPYLGTWGETVLFSARRVFTGFAAAIILGVPIGIMIGWNRLVAGAVDPLIHKPYLEELAGSYVPPGIERADPRVSPLFAELKALPPTLIQVGSDETLLSDSTRLAAAAGAADVAATLEVWPHMIHAWMMWNARLSDGRRALEHAGRFMQAHAGA